MSIEFATRTETTGGCLYPVLDPGTGKRSRLCAEPTTVLDQDGNTRGFCSKHLNLVEEFTKHRHRAKMQTPDRKAPKDRAKYLKIGSFVDNRNDRHQNIV